MDQETRAKIIDLVARRAAQLDKSRQITPPLGGSGGSAAPTGQILPTPPHMQGPRIYQDPGMRELNQRAQEVYSFAPVPKLQGEPLAATPLVRPKVSGRETHFIGNDITKWGGDVYRVGKDSYPVTGWDHNFATPADARRALLIEAINKMRREGQDFKPVQPQISEFASPESARQSWRVLSGDPNQDWTKFLK